MRTSGDRFVFTTSSGLEIVAESDARDALEYHLWRDRSSVEELRQFQENTRGRRRLFDVGAHCGVFSTVFCLSEPRNHALAFEPSPVICPVLRRQVSANGLSGRIRVREAAVGNSVGSLTGSLESGGFVTFGSASEGGSPAQIECTSLDHEWVRTEEPPDVLKIDVEGFEREVLLGASELLRGHHPLVFLELHLDLLERRGIRPGHVLKLLEDTGYRTFRVEGRIATPAAICDRAVSVVRLVAA